MQAPTKTLYLIDASSYVYRAFHALPPLSSPDGIPTQAVYGVATMILKLLRETNPTYVAAIFDAPGPTFRDELYAEYKAQRPSMPDDLRVQIPLVRELIEAFAIPSIALPGVEADDVIGTLARSAEAAGVNTIVITGDKDLMQLVNEHVELWDTMRDRRFDTAAVKAKLGVEPSQVPDLLGLMGDTSDNIPGVKGVGEKTATALISRFGSIEGLLAKLDELESTTDIRGAKKLAASLREQSELARLSRVLATLRTDVPIDTDVESYRYSGHADDGLRTLFTRLGFQRLLSDLSRSAAPMSTALRRLTDPKEIAQLTQTMANERQFAFAASATGVVVATRSGDVSLIEAVGELGAIFADTQTEKVAHDLKQDLAYLAPRQIPEADPAFDVMVASYLLEASPTHRLEDLATDLLSSHLPNYRDGEESLANGVSLLLRLRDQFAARLEESGMHELFYDVEMPLVRILAHMEQHGVLLDLDAFAEIRVDVEKRMVELVSAIYEFAGGEFNILSPNQLRDVLFEKLKLPTKGVRKGKTGLSTDVDVLSRLAEIHPLPAKILEYRNLAKLKSTYIDALPAAVNPTTGRLHTRFNQTVAATGRLSSSDPNLQNIPIRGEDGKRIRAAFVAPPGHQLLSADYSQIELRLLAHLANDQGLIDSFRSDEDIHRRTAAEVFGVMPGTVTSDMRRAAKVINFGILYGMGSQSLARELGVGIKEANQFIQNYFDRYQAVRGYLDRSREEARQRGYAITLLGRRRAVRDLNSGDRGLMQAAERVATNTPIQGSAADVIKKAMVAVDRRLEAEGVRATMILQVHDELLFEVADDDLESCRRLVREEMEGALALAVPLKVDIGVGRTWADAH